MEALRQGDFASGMVRDVAPDLIDERGAYDIRNMVLVEDGALKRRGGGKSIAKTTNGLTGIWSGHMIPGTRTLVSDSSSLRALSGASLIQIGGGLGLPHPRSFAYIGGLLFIGGGYVYAGSLKGASYSTGTVSVTNGSKTVTGSGTTWSTSNVDAGMLLRIGSTDRFYVVETRVSNTQLTLRDAYEGTTASGQSYSLRSAYAITGSDPYPDSEHYCVVANRLVWADGSRVYFTKDLLSGGPHTHNAEEDYWEIPDGALVTGLAGIGGLCLVFTTAGVWTLSGLTYDIVGPDGTPQQRLEKLTGDLILFGDAGIAYWEQMVIAPCLGGVYLLDGISQPVKLSQNVEPLWQRYTDGPYRPGGAQVHKGHYIVPIMDDAASVVETLVCRLDRAAKDRRRKTTFPWVRFGDYGGEQRAYALEVSESPREPRLLSAGPDGRVCEALYYDPDDAPLTDADSSGHTWSVVTRDFSIDGSMILGVFRYLRALYELATGGEIFADYGDGTRIAGVPLWDQVQWDNFQWAGDDTEFHELRRTGEPDTAPPDAGRTPHRWPVNKRRRRLRFRLRSSDAVACTLRSLEVLIRPPASRRR